MNDLIEAYKNTKYKVFETDIIIEIGVLNQDIDDLLIEYKSVEWAFITAYNPYSRVLTNDENRLRHEDLKELTKAYITFEGHGAGEDPAWEPELSLFIIGISKEEASLIGTKFEQNAIVCGVISKPPELLILNQAFN